MPDADLTRPDWLTPGMPEYRAAPPWVMSEMIALTPELAGSILATPGAAPIARLALETVRSGGDVTVTGCGTSEHGAMAIALLLEEAIRATTGHSGRVRSRQAFDAAIDPLPGGLVIGVTHDGGTWATLEAVRTAREAGSRTALVTFAPDGPGAAFSDTTMYTPVHDDSYCHTLAYTSSILAGAAIAASLTGVTLDAPAWSRFLASALAVDPSSVADTLHATDRIITAGMGPDLVTARELTLKIEEGPRTPAASRHLETLLHGHLVACDASTGLLLVATGQSPRRDRRLDYAASAVAALGIRPAAILGPGAGSALPAAATPGGRMTLPAPPPSGLSSLAPLLGGAAALQTLTLALVDRAGVNPDLIRREETPWREAAAIAEGATGW
jgi:glutamine---fructose-6-phosphate transaminase (isomerizing)